MGKRAKKWQVKGVHMEKAVVGHYAEVEEVVMDSDEVQATSLFRLLGPQEGFGGYVMRVFRLQTGGFTPKHRHDWVHINLVISGQGRLLMEDQYHDIAAGSYALVPSGTLHQFQNTGEDVLEFMCIIPEESK